MRNEEFEAEERRNDTEITLGPAMLLGIVCGLALLCALFFYFGYRAGRGSVTHALITTQSSTGQTQTSPTDGSISKPQAKGSMPAAVPQPVTATPMQPLGSSAPPQPNPLTSYAPAPESSPANTANSNASPQSTQAVVRPALPNQAAATPSAQTGSSNGGSSFMVQVAAVSRAEDANVLMNALRKRGYAVSARHVITDNLIHVQVGPFGSRADASATSQRLLSDGYNAVVIP